MGESLQGGLPVCERRLKLRVVQCRDDQEVVKRAGVIGLRCCCRGIRGFQRFHGGESLIPGVGRVAFPFTGDRLLDQPGV